MAAAIAYALHAPSLMPVESEPVVSEESVPEVNLAHRLIASPHASDPISKDRNLCLFDLARIDIQEPTIAQQQISRVVATGNCK